MLTFEPVIFDVYILLSYLNINIKLNLHIFTPYILCSLNYINEKVFKFNFHYNNALQRIFTIQTNYGERI